MTRSLTILMTSLALIYSSNALEIPKNKYQENTEYKIKWEQASSLEMSLPSQGEPDIPPDETEIESKYVFSMDMGEMGSVRESGREDASNRFPFIMKVDSIFISRTGGGESRTDDNVSELIGAESRGYLYFDGRSEFISFDSYIDKGKEAEADYYLKRVASTFDHFWAGVLGAGMAVEPGDLDGMPNDMQSAVEGLEPQQKYVYSDTVPLNIDSPNMPFPLMAARIVSLYQFEDAHIVNVTLKPTDKAQDPMIKVDGVGSGQAWAYYSLEDNIYESVSISEDFKISITMPMSEESSLVNWKMSISYGATKVAK